MAQQLLKISASPRTALYFDEPSNAAWFVTSSGEIATFRVLGQRISLLGHGWHDALAVFPCIDGLTLTVVLTSGEIFAAARTSADRSAARLVLHVGGPLLAAVRLQDGDILVLGSLGAINRVSLATGASSPFAAVDSAKTLAVDAASDELVVATSAEGIYQLGRWRLSDGVQVGAFVTVDGTAAAVAVLPRSGVLLLDHAGQVSLLLSSGVLDTFFFVAPGAKALCAWHSLLIVAGGNELLLREWGNDVELLSLTAGFDPLVPGGWGPLLVDYGALGLTAAEVEWTVREGPLAGSVSVARLSRQATDKYEHRVLCGVNAGEFEVAALEKATNSVLATRRFRRVLHWPDTRVGPPLAITGAQATYAKPGWGGGPSAPQNINHHPAPPDFRVALVVFRTKGAVSTVDGVSRAAYLQDKMIGPQGSVRAYYEEVSFRRTAPPPTAAGPFGTTVVLLGGRVFGPIDIEYSWGDLFEPQDRKASWSPWTPKAGTWDLLGGTFSSHLLDLELAVSVTQLADAVVFAVLPGTDAPYAVAGESWPAQWSWAFALDAQHYWKTPTSATFKHIPSVVMPAAMPAGHPAPWKDTEWVSTICHELGHTLGCGDLYGAYAPELAMRDVDAWDLMSNDVPLPHFSLPNRMRLGWIHPDWVEVVDFGKNAASRTLTLQAIETLTRSGLPAGRRAGVEIRLRDGWNYYFEFRRSQAVQIGDAQLPTNNAVFGCDVHQASAEELERPLILKLPDDVDGDGHALTAGRDYEESDVTNSERMNDFRIRRRFPILSPDPNAVELDIEYVGAHRAELQITRARGRGEFKSPDIDVDGPAGPNVVVKGRLNMLHIRVHNRGTKAADQVRIKVSWLPFTTAPGVWNALAAPATQNIPAHSDRMFNVPWKPPAVLQIDGVDVEHFCVRVDVERFVDPADPAGSEIVVHNNWAQSNFSTSAVAHASPSERGCSPVQITNKLAVGGLHKLLVEQSSQHFRSYVDRAWQWLAAGETGVAELTFESMAGDPIGGAAFERDFREIGGERLANDLRARTFVLPDTGHDSAIERWGVQLAIRPGLQTSVVLLDARGERVFGEVRETSASGTVNGGHVRLIAWPLTHPRLQLSFDQPLAANATFSFVLPREVLSWRVEDRILVQAYYLGAARHAPSRSKTVTLASD